MARAMKGLSMFSLYLCSNRQARADISNPRPAIQSASTFSQPLG
jgi:hypothetical protein